MDFKLTDEEKLVQSTAAQFVKKELLTREGDYLRQTGILSAARRSTATSIGSGRPPNTHEHRAAARFMDA